LENDGVGLGYSSAWADQVPEDLLAEIEQLRADIIAGDIPTMP
jgi:basic membrane lipoprotein Med (substrate-binding protein (PBP1-ABC) superfamily)